MAIPDDFQEIGHCGGTVTFHVTTTDEGRRSLQVKIEHSRPSAAAFFGIYALPQGVAIATIGMKGMGVPWDPPPIPGCRPVFIASDSMGMYGYQCPSCNNYWRARGGSICPYCAFRGAAHEFLTDAQQRYVQQYCQRLDDALSAEADGDYVIDMDAVADAVGKETEKPPFYYTEESQQNKFKCNACGADNDILGTYGYCSRCGTRNDLQELEKVIRTLRDRINAGGPYEGCVKDAVAAFDSFAGKYARQLLNNVPLTRLRRGRIERMHFHNLEPTVEMFGTVFGGDLLSDIEPGDVAFANRMFHRRHVYEHKGGEADAKYIEDSGDTDVKPKQALKEDQGSAHRIAGLVLKMAGNLHHGFHEILPPIEEPIQQHAAWKKSTRK